MVFLRPVGEAIRKRRAYINSVTSDYDRYQAQAKALRDEAESLRASARREAEHHLARSRAETSNASADLAGDYSQRAQKTIEAAQLAVGEELQAARVNQERLARELAEVMVERTVITS